MLPSIRRIVAQFKEQWAGPLETDELTKLCQERGLQWRRRVLTPMRLIRLFFLQILHGNVACEALPQLSGLRFTSAAYCTARKKLPLELFQRLLAHVTEQLTLCGPLANADRWLGHRAFLLDGTGFSLPDTPALRRMIDTTNAARVARTTSAEHASRTGTDCSSTPAANAPAANTRYVPRSSQP